MCNINSSLSCSLDNNGFCIQGVADACLGFQVLARIGPGPCAHPALAEHIAQGILTVVRSFSEIVFSDWSTHVIYPVRCILQPNLLCIDESADIFRNRFDGCIRPS